MPIKPIILQRRLTEVARIRIGQVVKTRSGKSAPAKLDRFRITSADKTLMDRVAALYGGTVQEWTPQNGTGIQWEVITDASSIPVIVPPQALSQYMELWSGGGCQRRCDGETELKTDSPCLCAAADNMLCKPTTRLSVMPRDIESIGVFRLESKGWNAAAELPGMAELLARAGGYIQARLYLKPVRQVIDGQTRDFMVPALAVDNVTPAQLLAGGSAVEAITAGSPEGARAIEAPKPTDPMDRQAYLDSAAGCPTFEDLTALLAEAKAAGFDDPELMAHFLAQRQRLEAGARPPAAAQSEDPDLLWSMIVAAAPEDWTTDRLRDRFESDTGVSPKDANATELRTFLQMLQQGVPA